MDNSGLRRLGAVTAAVALVFLGAPRRANAQAFSLVHEFSGRGGAPTEVIRGSDGNLYGAATSGGDSGRGAVFVLTPDGAGGYTYSELHQFVGADGARGPDTPLLQAADGRLYGATFSSPTDGGAIFRVDTSGTFAVLHLLSGPDEGSGPGRLVQPDGGDLYGVANQAGPQGRGTAFRMDASGVVTVVHVFDDATGTPGNDLLAASDGFMYGVAYTGNGLIFRMDLAGSVTLVHAFSGSDGAFPNFLSEGSSGTRYGTTASGGAFGNGTIFTWDAAGSVTTLYSFPAAAGSLASVVEASDGNLYGTVFKTDGGGTLFRFDQSSGFATLHEMSPEEDGAGLLGALLEVGGRLLGAAYYRGPGGSGTVFSAGFAGEFDLVHAFAQDPNGSSPTGGLIRASDGMLYGVAGGGGNNGSGTAYRLDLAGGLTRVHSFHGPTDGRDPQPSLIQASNGDLYGAALGGGPAGRGTVFRLSTSDVFTTLYAFSQTDVGSPLSEVVEGPGGDIFGTTTDFNHDSGIAYRIDGAMVFQAIHDFSAPEGGSATGLANAPGGTFYGGTGGSWLVNGSLFQMDASGTLTTLHAFGGPEGYGVNGTPLLASDGNLYGVTDHTVFRMDPAGEMVVLHDFSASGDRSFTPSFGLMEASDGGFYGTSYLDKVSSGAVVRIDASGNVSIVHLFQGTDGAGPRGTLVEAGDGYLYGTAESGGALGGGVVYRLDPAGLMSLSSVSPGSGPASGGTSLTLTGNHFQTGAIVMVGSIAAAGVVVSGETAMTAIAPALAAGMSYDVVVENPDGTRSSRTRAWLADPIDVAPGDLFHADVERIFRNGVTVGCGDGLYCVNLPVSRAQMAVLLLKAQLGAGYVPPPATGTVFADVPVDAFAAAFIEDLAARGVSVGCGGKNYCPDAPVTRAEMAPFLLKASLGAGYVPPPASGAVFDDVPADAFAADWIEDLAARGIAAGCSAQGPLYCPDAATTRGQMAALLVDAFGLQ